MAASDPSLDMLLSGDGPKLEPLLRWLLEASPVASVDGESRRTSRLRRLQEALAEQDLAATLAEEWNHASAIRLLAMPPGSRACPWICGPPGAAW